MDQKALLEIGARLRLEQIKAEITELLALVGEGEAETPPPPPTLPRRHMSPAARKRVSLRMKAYWAEQRKKAVKR